MRLSKEELKILQVCCEEPGDLQGISFGSKIDMEKVRTILNKLKGLGYVYEDKDVFENRSFWSSTAEGDKYFYKK